MYMYLATKRRKSPLRKGIVSVLGMLLFALVTQAQGLVFRNARLESGTAGRDGAVYRFSNVTDNVDALVRINGRSSSLVTLNNIDVTSYGFDKAFQPEVSYNSNSRGSAEWWMEFVVSFVKNGTSTTVPVTSFNMTALDIDGDGSTVNEYVSMYGLKSYTLENNTLLSVLNVLETVSNILTTTGKKITGPITNFTDIDTSSTRVMATSLYQNVTQFRMRTGGNRTSGTADADRMYSFWFKSFAYQAPVESSLPVVLSAFTAQKQSSKVVLSWSTEQEENVSQFVIQKSTNGLDYTDAAVVFTDGNSTTHKDYGFTDEIRAGTSGLLYYRLKIVDLNGSYKQSDVRIIKITDNQSQQKIQVYPNPAVSDVRVTLPQAWQNQPVTIQIVNLNGQEVKRIAEGKAGQTQTLNVSNVPAGIYLVKALCGSETAVQKIIVNK